MLRAILSIISAVFVACAVLVFGATVVRAVWYSPESEIVVPVEEADLPAPALVPTRIRIPALGIDAAVQHVGITTSGNMAVPSNYTDVGWYKYGPTPGESGSAVIAGHVNNGFGLSGVFEKLSEIEAGDTIFVTRADGSELQFIVGGKRTYAMEEAPLDIIFNPSGSTRLNLITCEGEWVADRKTYDERLVVFTTLASEFSS